MKWMVALALFWLSPSLAFAMVNPYPSKVVFSQEVVGYDPAGNPYPAMTIDTASIQGLQTFRFPLGDRQTLVIETNIEKVEERGLSWVVRTVQDCYDYIEQQSAISLREDILLYIIELDSVPRYYRFEATYTGDAAHWGQVRLGLIAKDQPLSGPGASMELMDLLLDTLPHELGHDILATIPTLRHDLDGRPSSHTRWFIEGVCEVLAKEFSFRNSPNMWRRYLDRRHVASILADSHIRDVFFTWSQENANAKTLESDLYGVSLLVLMRWTESISLANLIGLLEERSQPISGPEIMAMMTETTGYDAKQMLDSAALLGKHLREHGSLAMQGLPRINLSDGLSP